MCRAAFSPRRRAFGGIVDGVQDRLREGFLVVGRHEPAVRLAPDDVDEARRAAAERADHGEPASHGLEVDEAERLVRRRGDEAVCAGEAERQFGMAAPTGEEDAFDAFARGDGVRMLALPFARRAAPDHERSRDGHARPRTGVRAHEQRHALEPEEAPDEHQDRAWCAGLRVEERLHDFVLRVANAPR